MIEMLGGVLGAGASLYGGILQAEAQEDANRMNWAVNVMNYQQRERERAEAIAMANKLRREQKLGSTDIRGTSVRFVPGKGWVTTGSPEVLEMMKLQDAEQRKVLTQDLPMRRKAMERNYARSLEEEGIADTFKRQLINTGPARSDRAFEAQLMRAQTDAIRESAAAAETGAYTRGFRTRNNSNFPRIAEAMRNANDESYRKAALQAKLMARGTGQKEVDSRRNQLANLYNMFATRAAALPDVSYKPQNIDNSSQLESATKGDLTTGALATERYGAKGGTLDYVQPNLGYGNAVAGAGSALASAFRMAGAKNAYNGGGGVGGFSGSSSGGGSNSYYRQGENLG